MEYVLALLFLAAPTYVVRFSLFGLPANLLLIAVAIFWVIFAVWLFSKNLQKEFIGSFYREDKKLLWLIGLFFLAGVISLFWQGISTEKIGQFLVIFLEPITIFFLARFIFLKKPRAKKVLIYSFYLFLSVCGIYAVVQYFTLLGLPALWWGNSDEPKRALGFFVHPNNLALFTAPLLAWLIPDLSYRLSNFRRGYNLFAILAWFLGILGLLFSLSRGGWLGLFVAVVVFLIIKVNAKQLKVLMPIFVSCIIVVAAIPNLRYRIILPFYGEKSAVARLSLFHTGTAMLKDSPFFGKGLVGFSNNWDKYNTDRNLDHYNFPHNIFLNFWIDTGLLGLVSFLGLLIYSFICGIKNKNNPFVFGVVLFVVALVVHGLIDVPYLKNDLALLFWLIIALA